MPAIRRKFNPSLFKYSRGHGGMVVNPKLRGKGRYEGREPEGYVYQGNVPFRFQTPGGDTRTVQPGERISNRQYQNLRYIGSGWKSKAQYERISSQSLTRAGRKRLAYKSGKRDVHEIGAYRVWARIYAETNNTSVRSAMLPDSDFSRAYTQALNDNFSDLTPDGPFAYLLTITGLRSEDAEWNVGETQAA